MDTKGTKKVPSKHEVKEVIAFVKESKHQAEQTQFCSSRFWPGILIQITQLRGAITNLPPSHFR